MLAKLIDIWDVVYPLCQGFYTLFACMVKIFLMPEFFPYAILLIVSILVKFRRH